MTLSTVTQPTCHWPVFSLVQSSSNSSGECLGWWLGGYTYSYPAYIPDWDIARRSDDGEVVLHLVHETKGSTDLDQLQFPDEKRKFLCAQKVFHPLGMSYRPGAGNTREWWQDEHEGGIKPTWACR